MQKKMPHSFRKVSVSESPFLNRLILPAPVDGVLADYFLAAAEAIAERGITLDFGSAEELLKTNTDNRDSWNPLVPMYDFRVNALDASNLIVVLGRDATGKVVTANAIRRYDWKNTHFITEASSLRLMYDEPETMKRLNEECLISAANAHVVTGQTAFSGAAWVHPDWRHAGLGGSTTGSHQSSRDWHVANDLRFRDDERACIPSRLCNALWLRMRGLGGGMAKLKQRLNSILPFSGRRGVMSTVLLQTSYETRLRRSIPSSSNEMPSRHFDPSSDRIGKMRRA